MGQWGDSQEISLVDGKGNPTKRLFKVTTNCCDTEQWIEWLTIDGTSEELPICGAMNMMNMFGKEGHLCYGTDLATGIPIAKLESPRKADEWDKDDFILEIAPGVCMALIISLALAYDKICDGKN